MNTQCEVLPMLQDGSWPVRWLDQRRVAHIKCFRTHDEAGNFVAWLQMEPGTPMPSPEDAAGDDPTSTPHAQAEDPPRDGAMVTDVHLREWLPGLGVAGQRYHTTIDAGTKRGRNLVAKCFSAPDVTRVQRMAQQHIVTDVLFFPVSREDKETGEVSEWVATVFITRDGKTLKFGSGVVAQSTLRALDLFPRESWEAGLRMTVLELQGTTPERRVFDVLLQEQEDV